MAPPHILGRGDPYERKETMTTMTEKQAARGVDFDTLPDVLTTTDLATPRGISGTAVRQGATRKPLGAPKPDTAFIGRGRPWTWRSKRDDVRIYLTGPDRLAEIAEMILNGAEVNGERVAGKGSLAAAAKAIGVDRQTFTRVREGTEGWSQFTTQQKVIKTARKMGLIDKRGH